MDRNRPQILRASQLLLSLTQTGRGFNPRTMCNSINQFIITKLSISNFLHVVHHQNIYIWRGLAPAIIAPQREKKKPPTPIHPSIHSSIHSSIHTPAPDHQTYPRFPSPYLPTQIPTPLLTREASPPPTRYCQTGPAHRAAPPRAAGYSTCSSRAPDQSRSCRP
jgi:hypothetical protein